MFLVGRFFNGVGVSLMLAHVPLYQCEVALAILEKLHPNGGRGLMARKKSI